MRILLLFAVVVLSTTSIAVSLFRASPPDIDHVAGALDGVHAVGVVNRARALREPAGR